MGDFTALVFAIVAIKPKVSFNYTPKWGRITPGYIDTVLFPKVLTNKAYKYRVVVDSNKDLGIKPSYAVAGDGSQTVNFLEYNAGYGISELRQIQVYAVDPNNGNQYLIAKFK